MNKIALMGLMAAVAISVGLLCGASDGGSQSGNNDAGLSPDARPDGGSAKRAPKRRPTSTTLHSEEALKFNPSDYPSNQFKVSKRIFKHGAASIEVVQAKRTNRPKEGVPPYLCRAWLTVTANGRTTFEKHYSDIDPSGGPYGLFIPSSQPKGFFAVVKAGDYDGRLFLVGEAGRVLDLMGGNYFFSRDGRYLISEHDSDCSDGLVIFDLKNGNADHFAAKAPVCGSAEGVYFKDEKYYLQSGAGFAELNLANRTISHVPEFDVEGGIKIPHAFTFQGLPGCETPGP